MCMQLNSTHPISSHFVSRVSTYAVLPSHSRSLTHTYTDSHHKLVHIKYYCSYANLPSNMEILDNYLIRSLQLRISIFAHFKMGHIIRSSFAQLFHQIPVFCKMQNSL